MTEFTISTDTATFMTCGSNWYQFARLTRFFNVLPIEIYLIAKLLRRERVEGVEIHSVIKILKKHYDNILVAKIYYVLRFKMIC